MFYWDIKRFINPCTNFFKKNQKIMFTNHFGNYPAIINKIYINNLSGDFKTNCLPHTLYFNMMIEIKFNNTTVTLPENSIIQIEKNHYASLQYTDYEYINNIILILDNWNNPKSKITKNNIQNAYCLLNYQIFDTI